MPTVDIRRSDLERLAAMEQQILNISGDIGEIKGDVKSLIKSFSDGDFDRRITKLESDAKSSSFKKYIEQAITVVLTSAVTFLLINYLKASK